MITFKTEVTKQERDSGLSQDETCLRIIQYYTDEFRALLNEEWEDGHRQDILYTGKVIDMQGDRPGLTYFGRRFYDSISGVRMSEDPAILEDGDVYLSSDPRHSNAYLFNYNNSLRFLDPDGAKATAAELLYFARNPIQGYRMIEIKNTVFDQTSKFARSVLSDNQLKSAGHNDKIDAFRHALLSIKVTRTFGEKDAVDILVNHELGNKIPKNEIQIDMFNNRVGITAATDPKYSKFTDFDLAKHLLQTGQLQEQLNFQQTDFASFREQVSGYLSNTGSFDMNTFIGPPMQDGSF